MSDPILNNISNNQLSDLINFQLNGLRAREKIIIEHRHSLNGYDFKTLKELGILLGISQERVRQIYSKGIRQLRSKMYSKYSKFWEFIPEGYNDKKMDIMKTKKVYPFWLDSK